MQYEFHEFANLFPAMNEEEFEQLKTSIQANGLIHPIILFERKILDGKNRYEACQAVGVKPRFTEFGGPGALSFVIVSNLHRRHLTSDQRAAIAASIAMTLAEAEASRKAGKNLVASGQQVRPSLTTAAKQLHVKDNKASEARYVKEAAEAAGTPEVFEEVKAGKVSLKEAATKVGMAEFKARHQKPVELTDIEEQNLARAREMNLVTPLKKAGLARVVGGIDLIGHVENTKKSIAAISEYLANFEMTESTAEYLEELCEVLATGAEFIKSQLKGIPDTVPEDWS